jgi:hypothetical protein
MRTRINCLTLHRYAPDPADLPLAVCPKGAILKNPNETELASARAGPAEARLSTEGDVPSSRSLAYQRKIIF